MKGGGERLGGIEKGDLQMCTHFTLYNMHSCAHSGTTELRTPQ